jgi:hypothetical protein
VFRYEFQKADAIRKLCLQQNVLLVVAEGRPKPGRILFRLLEDVLVALSTANLSRESSIALLRLHHNFVKEGQLTKDEGFHPLLQSAQ